MKTLTALALLVPTILFSESAQNAQTPPEGAKSLFNGKDLSGWNIPEGDNGHWKVLDGVIDYDALSEAPGKDKNLWSKESFSDFELHLEWRIKKHANTGEYPIVLPDGSYELDKNGEKKMISFPNADSGLYLRGQPKAQVNIWCWPIGSGEVYGYRNDKKMSAEIRKGVTPSEKADKPVGEWNRFLITMKGDRLSVVLNEKTVIENSQLPDVPAKGPIALQHHGGIKKATGELDAASSLVQFRNIWIKEL